jgi:alkylation response protein AidB-like acyl-CoA dehydrogenase
MYIAYTPELEQLRTELREYFAGLLTADERAGTAQIGDRYREVLRQIGSDGWFGLGWPREFGGSARTPREQFIFFDEAKRMGIPIPMLALNTVGPTIMRFGTEEQQRRYLPGILRGELDFAIGYTEPDAGTDLASLKTRAVRDGDNYVINGVKQFTTGVTVSDYVWLAARTDPDAPKHKGLSLFLVPTSSEGFSYTEISTVIEGGSRATTTRATTTTYYNDVVVPESARIGPENAGWQIITSQLNQERVALAAAGGWIHELADDVCDWARGTRTADGQRLIDLGYVQDLLARVEAGLEAMKLLNWRIVSKASEGGGGPTPGESGVTNVYGTEVLIDCGQLLHQVIGAAGYLTDGSAGAVLRGRLEQAYRASIVGTFAGGNNDILRELIAANSLGMPRVAR